MKFVTSQELYRKLQPILGLPNEGSVRSMVIRLAPDAPAIIEIECLAPHGLEAAFTQYKLTKDES